MKRIVFGTLLVLAFVLIPAVGAQAGLGFEVVQIQFWPEYDSPEMLVIYTFELSETQPLPVEMSVRIPTRATSPTALAVLEGNQLVTREYNLSVEGDWTVVSFETDSPVIHLEYYDPALSQADNLRDFPFEWYFDYPVDELVIAFKQPLHATDVVFSSDLGAPETGGDGLEFYTASLGSLPAGETFSFAIEYQKSDDLLSAQPMMPPAEDPAEQPVATIASQNEFPDWGWVIVGVGAVILAGGGMYLWYINTPTAFSNYRQKKARSSTYRSGSGSGVFCHECGAKSSAGDKFCRECGTKLRK